MPRASAEKPRLPRVAWALSRTLLLGYLGVLLFLGDVGIASALGVRIGAPSRSPRSSTEEEQHESQAGNAPIKESVRLCRRKTPVCRLRPSLVSMRHDVRAGRSLAAASADSVRPWSEHGLRNSLGAPLRC